MPSWNIPNSLKLMVLTIKLFFPYVYLKGYSNISWRTTKCTEGLILNGIESWIYLMLSKGVFIFP